MGNTTTDTIVGLALALLAGVCNSLWNVPFSPKLNVAVGKSDRDLDSHYAWTLFLVYAGSVNIPLCLYWAGGPERVSFILENSAALDIALVVVFALLFGGGVLGFGIACQIAGVGLGTNLTIGLIMVLGTFLPLVLDKIIGTATGGVILAGLAISCVGLYFAMKSLQVRDQDELDLKLKTTNQGSDNDDSGEEEGKDQDKEHEHSHDTEEGDVSDSTQDGESPTKNKEAGTGTEGGGPSTLVKVIVCVLASIFAASLQFAFVFGEDLIDLASSEEGPGSTPDSGSAAIIWLFVIPLSTIPSIVYGFLKTNASFTVIYQCPWWRHPIIFATASIPWISHIHLYGLANTFLPADLSASIAWPVLMTTTVIMGMAWSVVLGEWKGASKQAMRNLKIGFAFLLTGVVVVMASTAV